MRVCTRCLQRNEDSDTFCSSCGTFLEWSKTKAARQDFSEPAKPRPARRRSTSKRSPPPAGEQAQPALAPEDGSAPGPRGALSDADELALAAENLRRRVEANRRRRAGLPPLEEPSRPRVTARAVPAPTSMARAEQDARVEAVAERPRPRGDPGPEQPQKAQPFESPRRPRQPPVQDDVALQPGDVPCARCQAPNAPSRHFCRRCGQSLQSGEAAQNRAGPATGPHRRRWWHRLLWWRRIPQDVPDTVALPPSWKERVWSALPVVVLASLVVLALGPFRPAILERLEDVRRRISPRYEQVYPAAVQATSAAEGHPPEAAVDRAPNTYWSEAGPTLGEGEELTFRFDRPVDLARIGFFNGAQAKPQDFLSQPRLREAHLSFDSAPAVSIVLKDRDAFQNHGIEAKAVTTVRLSIVSVYPSPQGGTDASLGEVEFFTSA